MAAKRKLSAIEAEEPVDPSDELMFLNLGGGNEVGRSCHILQYKGKTVMLDAGMHPAYEGLAALPFYDDFDLSTVDVLLISHFHIDHAASLPYVLSKTNFNGRIFMTHPTKAIYKWLIQDTVRLGNMSSTSEQRTQLFTETDHLSTFPQIEAIDYNTTHTVSSISITPYPAGHVLGAAMFHLSIAGLSILFTGDYSREADRHLIPATIPKSLHVDVLITESTYGIATHVPRQERETALMKSITSIINRGGRVLMPVFALGRAQELLLILDEYWASHPEYHKIPIYYASNLARKCMTVYQTYKDAMNDNIQRRFDERLAEEAARGSTVSAGGPWDFRHIRSLKSLDRFDDVGSCIILASPGMMQSGVSRELLERWAPDARNGVVLTGYSVEGTMGKMIMSEPDQIQAITSKGAGMAGGGRKALGKEADQVMIPRRCSVQEYSFAAHVDGTENREFIEEVGAKFVILVHGEKSAMLRLKSKLLSLNASKPAHLKTEVFTPPNCQEVRLAIRKPKTARVVGRLADRVRIDSLPNGVDSTNGETADTKEDEKKEPQTIKNAVLVQNDLKLSLMAAEDLREHAGITTTTITCRQKITLASASIELIKWALNGTFGGLVELPPTPSSTPSSSSSSRQNDTKPETNTSQQQQQQQQQQLIKREEAEEDEAADEELPLQRTIRLLIMDTVTMTHRTGGAIQIEWEGNAMNDGIADAVMAVLLGVESSPAAVKQSGRLHGHGHGHGQRQGYSHGDKRGAKKKEEGGMNGTTTPAGTQSQSREPQQSQQNPHVLAATDARTRLEHILMFLQAQFGESAVSFIYPTSASTYSNTTPSDVPSSTTPPPPTPTQLTPPPKKAPLSPLPTGLKIRVDARELTVRFPNDHHLHHHHHQNHDQTDQNDHNDRREEGEGQGQGQEGGQEEGIRIEGEEKNVALRGRVRSLVDRACETCAPLWSGGS
ncbi:MAG: endoribonuclease ysh1 [Chrysothrix sp. TS-e1954]|nr:MAG: endoribonuclease ysh1 [Chrysothrix sp. TS-e1954]